MISGCLSEKKFCSFCSACWRSLPEKKGVPCPHFHQVIVHRWINGLLAEVSLTYNTIQFGMTVAWRCLHVYISGFLTFRG